MKVTSIIHKTAMVLVVVVSLSSICSGQVKKITIDEYFDAINTAQDKTEVTFPRRHVSICEGGLSTKTTRVEEYLSNDKFKKTVETIDEGKTVINQYIRLGKIYYCKFGNKPWKKSRSECEPIDMMVSPKADAEEYSVEQFSENGVKRFVYRMYRTNLWPRDIDPVEFFSEQIVTVSETGLKLSTKVTSGRTKGGEITSAFTSTDEYVVSGIKVVAPIK